MCDVCAKLSYNDIVEQAKDLTLKEAHAILNNAAPDILEFTIVSSLNSDEEGETVWTGRITFTGCPLEFAFEEDKYQLLLKKFAVLARAMRFVA